MLETFIPYKYKTNQQKIYIWFKFKPIMELPKEELTHKLSEVRLLFANIDTKPMREGDFGKQCILILPEIDFKLMAIQTKDNKDSFFIDTRQKDSVCLNALDQGYTISPITSGNFMDGATFNF